MRLKQRVVLPAFSSDGSMQKNIAPNGEVVRLGDFYVCERRRFSVASPRFVSMCRLCRLTASRSALQEKRAALIAATEEYCAARFVDARRRAQVRGNAWKLYAERRRIYDEGTLTVDEWLLICRNYDGRCAYCGTEARLTIDHVIPISKGGRHEVSNVLPACLSCNGRKRDRVITRQQQFMLDLRDSNLPL